MCGRRGAGGACVGWARGICGRGVALGLWGVGCASGLPPVEAHMWLDSQRR